MILAQLLSGSRIDPGSGLVSLDLASVSNQWQILRARYPPEFTPQMERTSAWHEREAVACEAPGKWAGAGFHLNCLLNATPNDPVLRRRRALAGLYSNQFGPSHEDRKYLFGRRDADVNPDLIDLSSYFNRTLVDATKPGNDLAALPQGLQRFKGVGVDFDVRGMIQLLGMATKEEGWRDPGQILDIKVACKSRRLHFLQAVTDRLDLPATDGTPVGRYVVHYTDGTTQEIPLVYGSDLRNFWVLPNEPLEASNAQLAWTGKNQLSDLRLFHFTWPNPRPDVEVASIDFVSAMAQSAPFLIALTVEP